ncbi:MAG: S24 family peptidase [Desulfovibrionaceae bacterium]|nr:S24 family peptidase [Desulfovibrionaceae bacterium]
MAVKKETSAILDDLIAALGFRRDMQLAAWLGISTQAVSQARRKGKVPESWIVKAAEKTGLSMDELYFGRKLSDPADIRLLRIPLVSSRMILRDGLTEAKQEILDYICFRESWLRKRGDPNGMVLMYMSGDSMEPSIFHNDLILIDKNRTEIEPHTVYAVSVDNGIYIKELENSPGHILVLRSYNPRYAPMEIDLNGPLAESVKVIGKILWWCHTV